MNKEELLAYFNDKILKNENLADEVMEQIMKYINEESPTLTVKLKRNKYLTSFYIDEIKEELDGENHETARRMLYVISKMNSYILQNYNYSELIDDIKFLICIGYDLKEILDSTLLKNYRYFSCNEAYEMIDILCETFREQAENYIESLLDKDIAKFKDLRHKELLYEDFYREDIRSDAEIREILAFYTQAALVMTLIKNEKAEYDKYINKLIEFYKEAELTEELVCILYSGISYDERLFTVLKDKMLNKPQANTLLVKECIEEDSYLEFLKNNHIKTYPYYFLAATGYMDDSKKEKILSTLFKEDKETFYETYDFIKKDSREAYNSIYLLAIMLKNNEGKEILAADKNNFNDYVDGCSYNLKIPKKFEGKNIFEIVLDDRKLAEQYYAGIKKNNDDFHSEMYIEDLIKVFALLDDYEESAAKFIDFMLRISKERNDLEQLSDSISYFVKTRNLWLKSDINDEIDKLIDKKYINIKDIFKFLCIKSYVSEEGIFTNETIIDYSKNNQEEALEFLNDELIKNDVDMTLIWIEHLYKYAKINDYDSTIKLLKHKSKKVRDFCEQHIIDNEGIFKENLVEGVDNLKGEALKAAKRIIKEWDNERIYSDDFKFEDNEALINFVDDNYDKTNDKFTKHIDESNFEDIRFKDSEECAPSRVIRFIFNEYMALTQVYRIKSCDKIIDKLNIADFRKLTAKLFNEWNEDGADNKKKNIAIPYCIYSSDDEMPILRKQIEKWADAQRGALACYVINAITLNGSKAALMMVYNISTKFQKAKVKTAAKHSFKYAAKVLNVAEDELSDKIVPDLGFDKYGEKIIDYGARTFKIILMEDFTLSIFDNEKNKTIKSLPKPSEKDDKEKAESAKKEFANLKKQLKALIKTQTERLETIFANGRTWTIDTWKELFIENPIMQMFARRLIWGAYSCEKTGLSGQSALSAKGSYSSTSGKDKLIGTFRYMEDGTFNSEDEEEYEIPEKSKITIVHPCELSAELLNKWSEQLKDYEITQPFEQLGAEVISLKEDELDNNVVTRYVDKDTTTSKLGKMSNRYGFIRGALMENSINSYHYIDKYLKIAVQISFEFIYTGMDRYDIETPLKTVIFYKIDDDFDYDPDSEISENLILDPRQLPERFVSSLISTFDELILEDNEKRIYR